MIGLFFSIFAGALLLLACLIAIIALASYREVDEIFISKEQLFKYTEGRREKLTNEVIEYLYK